MQLRGYGLIEKDDGADRIHISDLAAVIFELQEAEALQRAFAAAGLNPEIIADYAAKWGAGRPTDALCIADLQTRHRFTAWAAKSFLPVFDEAMWFIGGGATGIFAAVPQSVRQVPPLPSRVRIGDFVQTPTVTANQVAAGRRVVWLADANATSTWRKVSPDTPCRRSRGSRRRPARLSPSRQTSHQR